MIVTLLLLSAMSGCLGTSEYSVKVNYDIDEVNQIWNQFENHDYAKRTTLTTSAVEIADRLIERNEIFLLRYWEPFVYEEENLDWTEDPYNDETWQFYFHSLRMVSYLLNAYEETEEATYLIHAKWFINSWMEHNPNPNDYSNKAAWDDHSTANRILTFIYFWDHYRDSEIFDAEFANTFLNSLRNHGQFTVKDSNYQWNNNHGIFQDRALIQLAVLFPIFEDSDEWKNVAFSRLSIHLETGVTSSGVHKEHSPGYHYLVLGLFMSISSFCHHYNVVNLEIDTAIYRMQEYLVHITKPDGTIPMVGDSNADFVLGISQSDITNEHLLHLVSDGIDGVEIEQDSVVYEDAGIAIFKNDWDDSTPIYFALFNRFHSRTHKHNDDLSFVLTYNDTDFFVDSGKYNYAEDDPFRIHIRSVFAHNAISIDGESYDVSDPSNVGKATIEDFSISTNFSFVKASHTLFEGVKVTRSVIFFNDGAIYFHDQIDSNEYHQYTQIFNIGKDISVDYSDSRDVFLSSRTENSSMILKQLNEYTSFDAYFGSNDPIRGWQSNSFNEVSPISSLCYHMEGQDVDFETVINIGVNIVDVETQQDGDSDVYIFELEDGSVETVVID